MTHFDFLAFFISIMASAIASVAGFGIGSILTPLLALSVGTKIAVAAVSIPHLVATSLRFWILRKFIDRHVLLTFGITSAIGGLIGALLHASFHSHFLTLIFSGLLLFAGFMGATGLAQKMKLHGVVAWIAGGLSGGFGGLVGNQGGIRSAALMTFDLSKESLVATGTAIGVIVDLARMPVYFWGESGALAGIWISIAVLVVGAILGTAFGMRFLRGISEGVFRRLLGGLVFCLGVYMICRG